MCFCIVSQADRYSENTRNLYFSTSKLVNVLMCVDFFQKYVILLCHTIPSDNEISSAANLERKLLLQYDTEITNLVHVFYEKKFIRK